MNTPRFPAFPPTTQCIGRMEASVCNNPTLQQPWTESGWAVAPFVLIACLVLLFDWRSRVVGVLCIMCRFWILLVALPGLRKNSPRESLRPAEAKFLPLRFAAAEMTSSEVMGLFQRPVRFFGETIRPSSKTPRNPLKIGTPGIGAGFQAHLRRCRCCYTAMRHKQP
jgi:hypothetical protein